MKKKLSFLTIVVALIVVCTMIFVACNNKKDDDTDTSGSSNITTDYNYQQIEEKVTQLAGANGIFVKLHLSSADNGTTTTYDIALGVKGQVYYILTSEGECYIDLSSDQYYDVYSVYNGRWMKVRTNYTEQLTKDTLISSYAAMAYGYFGMYKYLTGYEGVKSTTTIAERSCDKYTYTVTAAGATASSEVCVDKETGICLKWAASGSYQGDTGAVTFECTEFRTNYTPTLPQDGQEANVNPNGGQQGGNGTEDNTDEGDDLDGPGDPTIVVIGDQLIMRESYPTATFKDNFTSLFASGIELEYSFKVKDKKNTQEVVSSKYYAKVKGNKAFVKNDFTGQNAYYVFGEDSYTWYPYDKTIGDYNRTGIAGMQYYGDYNQTKGDYDIITKNEFILREIFGYNQGWDGSSTDSTFDIRYDWSNGQDMFNSLLFTYTRRGVDAGKFQKTRITANGRQQDKFLYAENVTEDNEMAHSYYIVIDSTTGICTEWYRKTNERYKADKIITGEEVSINLFDHIGFNAGDENDTTTIISSYPNIVDGTEGINGIITSGFKITFSVGNQGSRVGNETSFTIGMTSNGNIIYLKQGENEGIVDLRENDSFVRYTKTAGSWSAVKDYYADQDNDFNSKQKVINNYKQLFTGFLKLSNAEAHMSGMTKETITYLDDPNVDKYTLEDGYSYEFYVHKRYQVPIKNTKKINGYYAQKSFVCTEFKVGGAIVGDTDLTLPGGVDIVDSHAGGGGGESSPTSYTIYNDFGSETALENDILELSDGTGIQMILQETYDGEITTFGYEAKGGIYKSSGDYGEAYFDASDENQIDAYFYDDGEEKWIRYEDVEWSAVATGMNLSAFATYYYMEDDEAERETTTRTIGGRSYNVYRYSYEDGEVLEVEITTGICVYFSAYGITYQMIALKTTDVASIELPAV